MNLGAACAAAAAIGWFFFLLGLGGIKPDATQEECRKTYVGVTPFFLMGLIFTPLAVGLLA